jgi:hypothetical protein
MFDRKLECWEFMKCKREPGGSGLIKMATMLLLYSNDHQPELTRMMSEFYEKVNGLGVPCKAADFNEI